MPTAGKRVLVVANEVIGSRMAGPGIRMWHFAKELSRQHDVTLAVPNETDLDDPAIEIVRAKIEDEEAIERLLRSADAVVAQRLAPATMIRVARSQVQAVYDLYAPLLVETLALDAMRPPSRHRATVLRANAVVEEIVLRTGNAFVCGTERQRDFWLGELAAVGRFDRETYLRDQTLRQLIDVVSFGISPELPVPGPAIKGVVPGISASDTVLLWPGGVWNWFDPLTVIRAVARVAETRSDVRLFFLGTTHPNPAIEKMEMAGRAIRLSEELGLLGRVVFFNESWVPYAETGRYLLDADLAVSAHFDTLETHFSLRTRLLDCFWAALPIVATGGDELGDLAASQGGAVIVPPGDDDAFAAAIESVLADEDALEEMRCALATLREELAWPRLLKPLGRLVEAPGRPVEVPRAFVLLGRHLTARARWALDVRGSTEMGARATRLLPRRPRRR